MWICFRKAMHEPPKLTLGNNVIERVENFKLLGVWQQNNLKWNTHVFEIFRKANKNLYHLRECRRSKLPVEVGLTTYISKIRPILEYASPVWEASLNTWRRKLNRCRQEVSKSLAFLMIIFPRLKQEEMKPPGGNSKRYKETLIIHVLNYYQQPKLINII